MASTLLDNLFLAVNSYDELTPGLVEVLRGRLMECIPSDNEVRRVENYTYQRMDDCILITYRNTVRRVDVYIDKDSITGHEIKK
jgi:hypothetical protein